MLGTRVQSATLNSMASVGLNDEVTFEEEREGNEDIREDERTQCRGPKAGRCVMCLGNMKAHV